MYIYVMGGEGGPQKIGLAKNVQSRRDRLQTGSAVPLDIAIQNAVSPDLANHVEAYVHWLLRERRMAGEWFRVTPVEAREAIAMAVDAVGRGERQGRLGVGRKQINFEQTPARFPAGTLARIDAALDDGEKRSDLIREAVERELKRRERR